MTNSLDLSLEPLEALDAPTLGDFEAGVGVGIALVAVAVAAVAIAT